jgi:Ca2+-binding RTX toxin-like protein
VQNGTSADDTLFGTAVADRIEGLSGNDFISSGLGADTISGGSGLDVIDLGHDQRVDIVEFGLGSERDYVVNFDYSRDQIKIASNLASDWSDFYANSSIYQDGTSTVIEMSNGNEFVVLINVDAAFINYNNFIL